MTALARRIALFSAAITMATAAVCFGVAAASTPSAAPRSVQVSQHISAKRCAQNRAAGTITWVSPFSFDASAGILDVFAAKSLGYFSALCLSVNFVTNSYTPTELVSTGTGTITSEGSAADTLQAIAGGAHIVAISTYGNTSDYALLTQKGITKLTQLKGKIVAYHEQLPAVLSEMLVRAGVKLNSVHFVNDNTYNVNLLIEGSFQGLQAYQTNEPLTLKEEGAQFNEFTPEQYNIPGTFNVNVVNASFYAKHRGAVTDFLRADLHAFDYCAKHVGTCIQIEQKAAESAGATYGVGHSVAEWRLEVHLAESSRLANTGIGVETIAQWEPEAKLLKTLHLVKSLPSLSSVENTDMAASLYNKSTLIWPGP